MFRTYTGSALKVGSEYGHFEVVKYLVENYNYTQDKIDEVLINASLHGHLEILKYLIENGGDPYASGGYPFRFALREGHFNILDYLIENSDVIHTYDDVEKYYNNFLETV